MINIEYEMIPLRNLLSEYTERNGDSNYASVAVGRYGIRRREDIYSKALTKDFTKYKVIYNNTLTVGMGSNQIDIGVLSEDETYCVSPAYHTFKIDNVNSKYLEYCLKSKNDEMFKKYSKRGSRQGKTIDFARWLDYKVPICNENNQQKIVYNLRKIDDLIELSKSIINRFDELIKSQFVNHLIYGGVVC